MKTLALLRHGKSSWDDPALRDFDRPLNRRGREASALIGKELRRRAVAFDLAIASPARRVVETVERLEEGFGEPLRASFIEDIYNGSAGSLLGILRSIDNRVSRILMIGHNPGLHRLVLDLTAKRDPLRPVVAEHYPTAALALLELPTNSWAKLRRGTGRITDLVKPRDLANSQGKTIVKDC